MAAGGRFPWRWVIAGLAIAVIAMTMIIPPPGKAQEVESTDDTVEAGDTEENEPAEEVCVPDSIRVLVLNGTSIDGLASRTQRQLLRSSSDSTVILAPFDPSDTDKKPYEETILISHLADISAARIIADILGRPEDCIVWEVPAGNAPVIVDVTICIGEDMGEVFPTIE
ncbi:MAG: LytR C-terminal domain-containing protein [Candidatus Aegiribacteria sp.]|nr:LytR C-terminal domain-containing protein [Candidatus Aegiribacteria sp.]